MWLGASFTRSHGEDENKNTRVKVIKKIERIIVSQVGSNTETNSIKPKTETN